MWLDYNGKKTILLAIDESGGLQGSGLKPLFLLTNKNLIINKDKNDNPSVIPLSTLKIKTIDKQKIDVIVSALGILRRLLPLFAIGIFLILLVVVPVASFIINTIYILIAALIAYVIFLFLVKQRINFRKTLQISFHAVTLPLIIDYFLMIFRPTIYVNNINVPRFSASLPILFLILLCIFIFGGIYEAHFHHLKKN